MYHFLFAQLASVLTNVKDINPAYIDLAKIIGGSVAWIGGLTLYMWIREKRKVSGAGA